MDVNKIYFDLDGVLADFDRGLTELCGMGHVDQNMKNDAVDEEMFSGMRRVGNFYYQLKPIEEGVALFRKVREKYGDRCEILSGIPRPERGVVTAKDDKFAWVKRELGEDVAANIVLRREKILYCTGKNDFLVDDFVKNIGEWENAGGTGVFCPDAGTAEKTLIELGIL